MAQIEINKDIKIGDTGVALKDVLNYNDVYSTDEVKTDKTWIDGKPIYRKVIKSYFSAGTISRTYTLASIGLSNYSEIIELRSISQGNPIEGDYYTANNDMLRTFINSLGLNIMIGALYPSTPVNIYIIIEYTKTTD